MTLYTINHESGVAGQVVASGIELPMPGPSNITDANTVTYDATHVMHGSMATKHQPVDNGVSWVAYGNNANLSFDATGLAVRAYFYFTNTPGFAFLTFYDTAMASVAWMGINSSGYLNIRDDNDASPAIVGTVPVTVNRWLRAELYATVGLGNATITAALYDGDSTTPIDTVTTSTATTTGATLDAVWIGKNNYNDNPAAHWVDSVAIDTAATGFIGPFGAAGNTPFRVWDGSAYVPVDMRKWNGTSYDIVSGE